MYICKDCSYKGKSFPQGSCPACGSRNIGRAGANKEKTPNKTRSRISLAICILCWAGLAYALADKFLF